VVCHAGECQAGRRSYEIAARWSPCQFLIQSLAVFGVSGRAHLSTTGEQPAVVRWPRRTMHRSAHEKENRALASANAKFTRAQLPGSGAWHLSYALLAHAQGSLRSRPRSGARNCLRSSVRLRCGPVQRSRRGERAETSCFSGQVALVDGLASLARRTMCRVPSPDCTMRLPGDGAGSRRLSASLRKHEQCGRRGGREPRSAGGD